MNPLVKAVPHGHPNRRAPFMRLITPLAAVVVAIVMAAPASAVNVPGPPNVEVLPDPGHTLSKAGKKCAKKKRKARKKCKPRYTPPSATPPSATSGSSHWFRDVNGDGTLEVTFDTNSDGFYESTFYDLNQDGYYEVFDTSGVYGFARAFDTNSDTYYDVISLDPGSDGWWDRAYYDTNSDGWFDWEGYDVNPVDNVMDSFYVLQRPVNASVSPLVNENIVTMNLIRTQDPWAQQDPWGSWGGDAANNPLY